MYNLRLVVCHLFCLAMISSGSAMAEHQGIAWRTDMKQAYRESRETGKPMFVQLTADWCGYCTKMRKTTFTEQQVVDCINESFIPLMIDTDENEKFAQAVGLEGLPTSVIISPKLEMLEKLTGYKTSWELSKVCGKYQSESEDIHSLVEADVESQEPTQAASREELISEDQPTATQDSVADNATSHRDDASDVKSQVRSRNKGLPPLAFDGYCLVSALDDRKLVEGLPQFGVTYAGKMVFFVSQEHRDTFIAHPLRYWPGNNGICPVSAVEGELNSDGHLQFATVYHNRLWLFSDEAHRNRFIENPAAFAARESQQK
ncbi:MAG: thioredoxin family protein [Planctomycetaceae bacterium]